MKNILLLAAIVTLSTLNLKGQFTTLPLITTDEDPVISQYQQNMFLHNPAYAGYDGIGQVNFNIKNLYHLGDSSESKHYLFSLHGAVDEINSGLGATFEYYYDYRPSANGFAKDVAKVTDWKINLAYTYSYYINDDNNVRIGASIALGGRSEYVDNFVGRQSRIYGDLGFGLWYKYRNLDVGFSARHLNSPKLNYLSNMGLNNTTSIRPIFYITADYLIPVTEDFSIEPTLMIRYRNTNYIMSDFGVMTRLFSFLRAGFAYRMDLRTKPDINPNNPINYERVKILVTTLGAEISEKYVVMLSFDRYLQDVFNRNRNAIELTLGINFGQD